MRIAVNTRLLLAGRLDGIGWFSCESLRRIVCTHTEHEFFFFFDRKADPQFIFASNVHPVVLHPQARHPLLWRAFFDWSITKALKRYKIDIFLSPDGWLSLRTNVPTIDVIHDLNFEHANDYLKPSHQRYMTRFFPRFARKATRLATVSEYSKKDIVEIYGIEPSKIDVVYNGSNSHYHPCNEAEKIKIKEQYTEGNPYFVFIGTLSRRKNLENILLAFELFKQTHKDSSLRLVVAGSKYNLTEGMIAALAGMEYKNHVLFIGHVDAETLALLLGSAEALVYTSLFEGFGIPIVESFYAETPVITSNVTSMPEVAGDAALIVDPYSVEEIADAMNQIITDADIRNDLIAKGRVRRSLFSWDRTAELLWACIQKVAETLPNR
ncbi:MAG: glycosyltransferase family 4 protein [Bacteroidales bacterium]|nr:glycosyltransferase family 4 protein [Bacteroidales bacterium]